MFPIIGIICEKRLVLLIRNDILDYERYILLVQMKINNSTIYYSDSFGVILNLNFNLVLLNNSHFLYYFSTLFTFIIHIFK